MIRNEWDYNVEDDVTYTIEIRVGDGQKGHSTFRDLNGTYVQGREVLEHELGTGSELRDKYIKISTTATDINQHTNRVVVSYLLNGELIDEDDNPVERDADEDHGSVHFITKISFVS